MSVLSSLRKTKRQVPISFQHCFTKVFIWDNIFESVESFRSRNMAVTRKKCNLCLIVIEVACCPNKQCVNTRKYVKSSCVENKTLWGKSLWLKEPVLSLGDVRSRIVFLVGFAEPWYFGPKSSTSGLQSAVFSDQVV